MADVDHINSPALRGYVGAGASRDYSGDAYSRPTHNIVDPATADSMTRFLAVMVACAVFVICAIAAPAIRAEREAPAYAQENARG